MKNGTCWLDTDGERIQAHGGCIINHGGVYYWYGENKALSTRKGRVDFNGFSCYSSGDLNSWKNEGIVLKAVNECGHELNPGNVGERPKVLFNRKTGKFVMLFHLDAADYSYARVGVALADNPLGPFVYETSWRPLGRESRDMFAFVDDDGSAYVVSSADMNSTTLICKLNDSYTAVSGESKAAFTGQFREAHVILKEKGKYYHFSSGCTGWKPNSMLYAISSLPLGDWKLYDNPCSGKDYRKTFYGQTANAFSFKEQQYIMLDHWKPEDLGSSGYSFLPVYIDDDYVEIPWTEEFDP
ncbi:MAG: glycoside hydrolase family 43 protein [Treponema sp.]|jgi:hypothetical protein|nr:glycoside hydrolase family 43 protein [Treponema sp.]